MPALRYRPRWCQVYNGFDVMQYSRWGLKQGSKSFLMAPVYTHSEGGSTLNLMSLPSRHVTIRSTSLLFPTKVITWVSNVTFNSTRPVRSISIDHRLTTAWGYFRIKVRPNPTLHLSTWEAGVLICPELWCGGVGLGNPSVVQIDFAGT